VPGTVGPAQNPFNGSYDPYEFSGVSTSEYDALSNQGVPRNWIGINNSSGQINSTNGVVLTRLTMQILDRYSWNKNDPSNIVSNDSPTNENIVSTGDRSTVAPPGGIANNWLVPRAGQICWRPDNQLLGQRTGVESGLCGVRLEHVWHAAAALAAPNTGVLLTGTETFQGLGGTPNDGSSYQNVG